MSKGELKRLEREARRASKAVDRAEAKGKDTTELRVLHALARAALLRSFAERDWRSYIATTVMP